MENVSPGTMRINENLQDKEMDFVELENGNKLIIACPIEVNHYVSRPYRVFCIFKRWYWRISFIACNFGIIQFKMPVKFFYCGKYK